MLDADWQGRRRQAMIAASPITLLARSLPLIQVLCEPVLRRRLSLRAFTQVSEFVRWAYVGSLSGLRIEAQGDGATRLLGLGYFMPVPTRHGSAQAGRRVPHVARLRRRNTSHLVHFERNGSFQDVSDK